MEILADTDTTRMKAIHELRVGEILTKKLCEMLGHYPNQIESDIKSISWLVDQISETFDTTLSILTSNSNLNQIPRTTSVVSNNQADQKLKVSQRGTKSKRCEKDEQRGYKRRKNSSMTVEITSSLIKDGYAWRKYGQKVIFNSRHERNYYRCTHKFDQGCQATKQIQKIDEEPAKYKIAYYGTHTCNNLQRPPKIVEASNPTDHSVFLHFEKNEIMKNESKVSTCFLSLKDTPKEGFLSSDDRLKDIPVSSSSSNHHALGKPINGCSSQDFSESMPIMSSESNY